MKNAAILAVASVLALGAAYTGSSHVDGILTGSFTEANPLNSESKPVMNQTEPVVEEVYWNFSGEKISRGRIAKHNFTAGTHNVTVTVKKSNGEVETYERQITVKE